MKKIIVSLFAVLLLISCKDSEAVLDYSQLDVSFVRTKMDVGEKSEILEIPILLSGVQNDVPLEVAVELSTTDDTALAGVDFELLDKTVTFDNCGKSVARIKIIDNNEFIDVAKCFTVNVKPTTSGVKANLSTTKVYIISDEMKKVDIVGSYTFSAEDFKSSTKYTSAVGGVKIERDATIPTKYYIRKLVLVNGTNVFPLTVATDLYFNENDKGLFFMPTRQDIGDYGKGNGFIMGMNSTGYTVDTPIELKQWGNKLYFVSDGFAGITLDAANKIIPYYLYKKLVLEKITN